jgi:transposase InsO family protein
MRRKRFSEEQIVSILKESAAGMKTEEVCRRHGTCTNTFYRWKAKYADMEVSDIRKLKALEQNWFTDLSDAKAKIESWRQSYNTIRPHSSLNDDTPAEFAGRFEEQKSNENPLVQLV